MSLLEHAVFAAAIQLLIGLSTGRWWAGAALASGYFIGREAAQAEYRWIEHFGGGLRANMPWNAVFDRRVWQNGDQIADWLGPLVTTVAIALVADGWRRRRDDGLRRSAAEDEGEAPRP